MAGQVRDMLMPVLPEVVREGLEPLVADLLEAVVQTMQVREGQVGDAAEQRFVTLRELNASIEALEAALDAHDGCINGG